MEVKSDKEGTVHREQIITILGEVEASARVVDVCLNQHVFTNLQDARKKIEAWRINYNTQQPHGLLGQMTLVEFTHRFYEQNGQITNMNMAWFLGETSLCLKEKKP